MGVFYVQLPHLLFCPDIIEISIGHHSLFGYSDIFILYIDYVW